MTLNEEYLELCAGASECTKVKDSLLKQVLADFGDIRYDGDRYKAFANWWRSKGNDTETMGEYLFAEPVAATKVMLVDDAEAAKQSANDASSLLINIPKNLTRKQIDKALDNIFVKNCHLKEVGKQGTLRVRMLATA